MDADLPSLESTEKTKVDEPPVDTIAGKLHGVVAKFIRFERVMATRGPAGGSA